MDAEIENIIKESLLEILEETGGKKIKMISRNTTLYGVQGILDSLALVRLVAEIEGKISEKLNKDISLVNERALSQKNSPFLTIGSLTDYIVKIINES